MAETLPRFGFDKAFIAAAGEIILNSFSENYRSAADMILHDARYDYLGRVDYIKLTDKLYRERNEHGLKTDIHDWSGIQKELLNTHDFMTKTGRLLRSVSLEEQAASLESWYK
jgi:hypothetical protein